MNTKQKSQLIKLGLFTPSQAKKVGLSYQALSRLVSENKILRMGRGIYLHPECKVEREVDFQVACSKFGSKSVIGGLSALFYYNLAEQVPQQIWVLVPPDKRTSEKSYRLLRTKTNLDKGVITKKDYRIVCIERAITEGLKLATKIGERVAIKAARDAIQQKKTTLKKIGKMAKELEQDSIFNKYFEAIIA